MVANMTFENLSQDEQNAVMKLKERMEGCMKPEMYSDLSLFVRFLRARDLNLNAAETMLRNHLEWRKINQVDTILTEFTTKEVVKKYIPLSFLGFDKEGSPIIYINLGAVDSKGILKACRKVDIVKYAIFMLEQNVQRLKEQSAKMNKIVDKFTMLINFSNLPFSVATHKQSLEVMGSLIRMYEGNYPERLKVAYLINSSYYFTLAFSVLKHFISEKTLNKIRIHGNDGWLDDVLTLIPEKVLPAFLGGKKTDPDGNPLCRTFIAEGGPVDPKYFINRKETTIANHSDVKKLSVTRMSKYHIPLVVTKVGAYIEWEFETKNRDIAFSLFYKKHENDSELKEIIPKQRIDAHLISETGMIKCEDIGIYVIEFDNSFSWIFKKEIYYRISVVLKR